MKQILGHSTRWKEEKAVPSIRIGGIRPGGIVDVLLPAGADPELIDMPKKITAVYTPAAHVNEKQNVTPESLLGSGGFSGSVDVPSPIPGSLTIRVPGIKPGDYEVQLIYDMPDDADKTAEGSRLANAGQGSIDVPPAT